MVLPYGNPDDVENKIGPDMRIVNSYKDLAEYN